MRRAAWRRRMPPRFDDIGHRLKAFRLGSGLSAEEIAQRLGISRTALYRFEKGEVVKIDTLEKLAELLNVSLPTLLGVGVEYIPSAVTYFERMRQIEETAEHIVVLAGPVSYLLASDAFNATLAELLKESVPEGAGDRARAETDVDEIIAVLKSRKDTYRRRQPAHRQSDRGLRDHALSDQRPRRPPRSPRQDQARAPRAGPRRGRALRAHHGGPAHRRADRHRARDAAAHELPDLPPARPSAPRAQSRSAWAKSRTCASASP